MAQLSQRTAIQYSGVPRRQSEATHMMIPHGTTVTSIHSAWSTERSKAIGTVAVRRSGLACRRCARDQEIDESRRGLRAPGCRADSSGGSGTPRTRRALAGQHQVRLAAGGGAGLQVAQAVAHHRRALEVDAEALADLLEQARLAACGSRSLRRGCAGNRTPHRSVPPTAASILCILACIGVERRHVEQAAAEARLVRRDHHVPARMVEPRDGLERAGQRRPLDRAT